MYSPEFTKFLLTFDIKEAKKIEEKQERLKINNFVLYKFSKFATIPIDLKD